MCRKASQDKREPKWFMIDLIGNLKMDKQKGEEKHEKFISLVEKDTNKMNDWPDWKKDITLLEVWPRCPELTGVFIDEAVDASVGRPKINTYSRSNLLQKYPFPD